MQAQCRAERFPGLTKAGVKVAREERFYVPLDDDRELIPKHVVCGSTTTLGLYEISTIKDSCYN